MLDQVLDVFRVVPDYNLGIMKANQTLFTITTSILEKNPTGIRRGKPDIVLVHGDTTTTFATALAAFIWASKWGMWKQAFGLTIFKAHILKSLTVKLLP